MTTEQASVERYESGCLRNKRIKLCHNLLVDTVCQGFLQLWWQLQVWMFYRELYFEYVVEAKVLLEVSIQLHVFELLEEKDQKFGQSFWVFI